MSFLSCKTIHDEGRCFQKTKIDSTLEQVVLLQQQQPSAAVVFLVNILFFDVDKTVVIVSH
ncbi:hypothetical protein ABD70_01110 [Alkalihalobacillus lehensis]|nr:hypothetical protein [Shouchella lehensis]